MAQIDKDEAPGWHAIDAACERLYPGQKEVHVAAVPPPGLGGSSVLNGVSVYQGAGDTPHWHYVTYGLTELFGKESSDPDESGFGFELTFRLRRGEETEPPKWPFEMLQGLGRYVFNTGNVFEPGHYRQRLAPIVQEIETQIFSLIFIADPDLPDLDTPNGKVRFVQAVGITSDEMDAVWNVGVDMIESLLARRSTKRVTDIARTSILADPVVLGAVEDRARQDGSPTEVIYGDRVEAERDGSTTTLIFSATTMRSLLAVLPYRWPFGRELSLYHPECVVVWGKGDANAVRNHGIHTHVTLDDRGYRELLATLRPVAGNYAVPSLPGLSLQVEATEIRNAEGKVVYRIGAAG
ncbi:suppressor of fused domain protein [Labrys neptuniae]